MEILTGLRVKITEVRGIYPNAINREAAYAFAWAFAQMHNGGPLLVAYDGVILGKN